MCESFFATLECGFLAGALRRSVEGPHGPLQLNRGWYNPGRHHSALGYLSPTDYERSHQQQPATLVAA